MAPLESRECTGVVIRVPWGHISGKWWGPQTGQPILALHGWQDNAGTFDTIIPLLPSHIPILAIDLPGHGYSSRLPDGHMYNIFASLNAVLMVMQAYKWDSVSILGHSMGSILGFQLAGIFPQKVNLLIGLDSYRPVNFVENNCVGVSRWIISSFLAADEQNRSQEELPAYTYDECLEKLHIQLHHSVDRDKCRYILERNIRKSEKYPNKYCFARDNRLTYQSVSAWPIKMYGQVLANIKCPVLYIRTMGSPISDDVSAYEGHMHILRENPKFEKHEVDGRRHVHLNEPEKVAGIITQFLYKYKKTSAKL